MPSLLLCFNSEDVQNCLTTARNVPCGWARGMFAIARMYALAIVFQQRRCPELVPTTARNVPCGRARGMLAIASMYALAIVFQQRRCPELVPTTARNVPCGRARGMLAIARMYALAIVFQQRRCPELVTDDCNGTFLADGPGGCSLLVSTASCPEIAPTTAKELGVRDCSHRQHVCQQHVCLVQERRSLRTKACSCLPGSHCECSMRNAGLLPAHPPNPPGRTHLVRNVCKAWLHACGHACAFASKLFI